MRIYVSPSTLFLTIYYSKLVACLDYDSPNVINFDLTGTRANKHPIERHNNLLSKRSFSFQRRATSGQVLEISLNNSQYAYYQANIKIGTPRQSFQPVVDTGSSDLWVLSNDNPFCESNACSVGQFNFNDSSTFQVNSSDFSIQYGDYSFAQGLWGTDDVQIENTVLSNCSLGVALVSNTTTESILGMGLPQSESIFVQSGGNFSYENVPQLLSIQHSIAPAYSLWLNDPAAQTGQLLCGGVDHSKYDGTLFTVPMVNSIPEIDFPVQMAVVLSGLSIADDNGDISPVLNEPIAVILDSGTTFSLLPSNILAAISKAIGGESVNDAAEGAVLTVVDCGLGNSNASFVFNFSGGNITVPFSEVLFELSDSNGEVFTLDNGDPACALGFLESIDGVTFVLGDSFLTSAYVVYDLDNLEISLANAKFNVTSSDIQAIGSNGVPSAVRAPSFSATQFQTAVNALSATGVFTIGTSVGK